MPAASSTEPAPREREEEPIEAEEVADDAVREEPDTRAIEPDGPVTEPLEPVMFDGDRPVRESLETRAFEPDERVTEPVGADAVASARGVGAVPRRRVPRAAIGVGIVLVAAVATGILAGGSGERESPPPAADPDSPALAAGALAFRGPAGWTTREAPSIAGLRLRGAAAAGNGESMMVAGTTAAAGPTLLPADFTQRLASPPKPDGAVSLGGAQAYRLADLTLKDSDGAMTLLVAPTTAGVATIACLGTDADRARCETAAGSLALSDGVRPLRLGPSERYARELKAPLDRLRARRGSALRKLRSADTPDGQARALDTVASAYRKAAAALGGVAPNPPERPAHSALRRAITRAGNAYGSVADAAREQGQRKYSRARKRARAADRVVNRALAELRAFGYRVR